ncbi:hypothetical protein [Paenibacillus sp. MER 99-2]|uniref:hypothetical protein n=1 Tax=Paenibacillus sp. MER 99-2 TaxID=2939572 RepID=UPI00203E4211|nr:hypothetical protein [Paenibacillus sp. MER 99-2]MCM3173233.1 hypothetical protein [Paenibacillus sp. MER 99-2]
MSYYELAANRIRNIDPNLYIGISQKRYEEVRTKGEYAADATLIAEYYRRVGVFLQHLSKESTSIYVGMDWLIGYRIPDDAWDNFVVDFPNFKDIDLMIIKLLSMHYLRWCSLLDDKNSFALQYPDIYEPIITLFERGGGRISTHHHELVGGFGGFPKTIYATRGDMNPFDISEAALEMIIEEVKFAEAYLQVYKNGDLTERNCIRCGNRLLIHSHITEYGYPWYKIKCESENCFDRNFS